MADQNIPVQQGAQNMVQGAQNMIQSSMALAFKPSLFNGLHSAGKWLQNFTRYTDLTALDDISKCNLFGLCMSGPPQSWFNGLTVE